MASLTRKLQAFTIVCDVGIAAYFPAVEIQQHAGHMTFGEVVRQVEQLNAHGFLALSMTCKGLVRARAAHAATYRVLHMRLSATYNYAANHIGWPPLPTHPFLRDGKLVLERIENRTSRGLTQLMFAAAEGNIQHVRLLLRVSADVNARRLSGSTALMDAAMIGHDAITQALLSAGADFHAVNIAGCTALSYASMKGHRVVLQRLKEAGAYPRPRTI